MNVREKLTPTEQALAWVIGLGILLALIALILFGFNIVDNDDITISLLIVGLAIAILGIGAWLILVRPWTEFDDLKTPLYTNQHEPAHAGPGPAAGAIAEAPAVEEAEAAPEPVAEVEPATAAAPAAAEALPSRAAAAPAAEVAEAASEPVAKVEPPIADAPAAAAEEAPAEPLPSRAAAAPTGPADDLTRIDGIGPKTAQALTAAGITRYEQVASTSPEALQAAAHEHGSRVVTTESWPEQARALLGEEARDDLTVVEGIGPKSQEALYAAGIRTYAALAEARQETLRDILEAARLRLLAPDTWPEQAGYLMRGDLDGFRALQETLKGGRRV